MLDYWLRYHHQLMRLTTEHFLMVMKALAIATVVGLLMIYLLANRWKWLERLEELFSVVYTIPSYALFVLLLPVTGLGNKTAIVVLVIYCEYILLRSFATGLREIDPVLIEVARAMGMNHRQLFLRVQWPLMLGAVFTGIRTAMTAMISIATIAATINAGGLGELLFDGLRTQSIVKLLWGMVLTVILCTLGNLLLTAFEKGIHYYQTHQQQKNEALN